MLFKKNILEGIAAGKVTQAFRRWRRPSVKLGSQLHTSAGLIEIVAMEEIQESVITEEDATRAGYASLPDLLKELNGFSMEGIVYRIAIRRIGDDPREALREDTALDAEQFTELRERLSRLDRASRQGPWTAKFLHVIVQHPAERAANLATLLGWDTDKLKLNVRKLKNLGLTVSLGTGYRISPRGESYLRQSGLAPATADDDPPTPDSKI
ncbi:hypothetical protein [Paenibacillus daejeonensis]|uniref:hypothetical protein n=1 Tax=Paenibacillus daejeonensis TaxID=135193 RepID=UPI00035E70A9|nr:hypothetical protein [Paenibacillus daejeonensis]